MIRLKKIKGEEGSCCIRCFFEKKGKCELGYYIMSGKVPADTFCAGLIQGGRQDVQYYFKKVAEYKICTKKEKAKCFKEFRWELGCCALCISWQYLSSENTRCRVLGINTEEDFCCAHFVRER
jgi:hypothetical protein